MLILGTCSPEAVTDAIHSLHDGQRLKVLLDQEHGVALLAKAAKHLDADLVKRWVAAGISLSEKTAEQQEEVLAAIFRIKEAQQDRWRWQYEGWGVKADQDERAASILQLLQVCGGMRGCVV